MDKMNFKTLSQVSEMLGVSQQVLRREVSKKRLAARKLGARLYFAEEDIKRYLDNSYTSNLNDA